MKYYIMNCPYLKESDKTDLLVRAQVHDMDKLTMYVFGDKKRVAQYHRENNKHHIRQYMDRYGVPSRIDILEAIFDYECAALTKSDKKLNAYDTISKYFPELLPIFLPFLQELHMDSSYDAITKEAIAYINQVVVNEAEIEHEIQDYIHLCIIEKRQDIVF